GRLHRRRLLQEGQRRAGRRLRRRADHRHLRRPGTRRRARGRPAAVADARRPQRLDRLPRRLRPARHRSEPDAAGDFLGPVRLRPAALRRSCQDERGVTALHDESMPSASEKGRSAIGNSVWLLVLLGVLVLLVIASITIGSRNVDWADIVAALGGATDNIGQGAIAKRIPRTVLALLVGAALGLAGAVMQGVTRNPLADPGILGVNMGASLAVVIGMAWFGLWTQTSMIWVAIIGAAAAAVFVYTIGS